jgi:hypothetical protein
VTRKELMKVIAEVTTEAGFESDPEFVEEFAGDLADRLDEEFGIIDAEDEDFEDEEEDEEF